MPKFKVNFICPDGRKEYVFVRNVPCSAAAIDAAYAVMRDDYGYGAMSLHLINVERKGA